MLFENQIVMLTGANGGLGRALIQVLLTHGVKKIYAVDRNMGYQETLREENKRIVPILLDIRDAQKIEEICSTCTDVNLLINNAAILLFQGILHGDYHKIEEQMQTNYFGTVKMLRALAPILTANAPSKLVNIVSLVALASIPAIGAYCASKAALMSLTQSIKGELAGRGVATLAVYPGAIDTPMSEGFNLDKARPIEVAEAIVKAIKDGKEVLFPDAMSQSVYQQWQEDHLAVEKQFAEFV